MITRLSPLLLASAALLLPATAVAKDGDIERSGSCTGASSAKIKLSEENGSIETEFEVDQNRNGIRWTVRFYRNGKRVARRTATTRGPSGSFEVRKVVSGGAGDVIRARARSQDGDVCRARATFG